jgi:hypothetical protein
MAPGGAGPASAGALVPEAPAPHLVYLDYADGAPLPRTNLNPCHGTPPRFRCGSSRLPRDCAREIQAYLDRWYADFNLVFTLDRPKSGSFHTVVVTSGGGGWCGVEGDVAGVAPFLCNRLEGGAVYAFRGGEDARASAIIIAQEQAHLVGLEHTASDADLMSPTICTSCDGFNPTPQPVVMDRCGRPTQDSYQMMRDRLGAWPGGVKPSAFGCAQDSPPPALEILEPGDASVVGPDFSVRVQAMGDCAPMQVEVEVTPQILHAVASAPPFKWDLSNISGEQTIVVTATDTQGRSTRRAVTVIAAAGAPAGCAVAGGEARSMPTSKSTSGGVGALALALATATLRHRRHASA